MMLGNFWKNVCLLLVFLSISFNITYWAIAKYDVSADFSATGDSQQYIEMTKGNFNVQARYAKRFLVPVLAGWIYRNISTDFLCPYYENINKKKIQLSYGIINIIFLTLTAFLFYYYCRVLKFSDWESITAALFYLTSFFVVTYYTIPLVDSISSFLILAGFYSILRNRPLWLCIIFLLGVFVKETIFVLPLVLFLKERRLILRQFFVFLPGLLSYYCIYKSFGHLPGINIFDIVSNPVLLRKSIEAGVKGLSLYTVIETVQVFMFFWVLFIYALWRCDIPSFLRKQLWLMILPFVIPFFVYSGSVGRVSFYLFPVAIPIAVLALRHILEIPISDKR